MSQKKIVKKKLPVSDRKLSSLNKNELNALVGGNQGKPDRMNSIDMLGQLNRGYM